MTSSDLKTQQVFVSNNFKLWAGGLIFFLSCFHLYTVTVYPNKNIIPKEIILGIVLALIVYLWVQEIRDRHRVQVLNTALALAQHQLQEAELDTITALILTQEAKDSYTRGHSSRVARVCLAIAQALGFPTDRQHILGRAAILHDLGKIGIPAEILNKPGKLTEEEWGVMKQHPRKAVDILDPLKFLEQEKKFILHHHGRIDGKGYPTGLKGKLIPLESRIISVADTFDAMNSARPYRPLLTREFIVAELQQVAGAQLDPEVVSVFLKLLDTNPDIWGYPA